MKVADFRVAGFAALSTTVSAAAALKQSTWWPHRSLQACQRAPGCGTSTVLDNLAETADNDNKTTSSAVAEKPRDASCLSVKVNIKVKQGHTPEGA